MSIIFRSRRLELERMDVEPLTKDAAVDILKTLETINAWLGGTRATLWHLKRFSRRWSRGQKIRVIDWGTGGADIPRAIVRWARAEGFLMEIVGVDSNAAVLDYARNACASYPEISLYHDNLTQMNQFQEPFDYAISSLCLHHLSNLEIVDLLKKSDHFSVRGVIMNDLRRSARA